MPVPPSLSHPTVAKALLQWWKEGAEGEKKNKKEKEKNIHKKYSRIQPGPVGLAAPEKEKKNIHGAAMTKAAKAFQVSSRHCSE